jgi:hypothetical protein
MEMCCSAGGTEKPLRRSHIPMKEIARLAQRAVALSGEVDTSSRQEKASKQQSQALVLIQSETKL